MPPNCVRGPVCSTTAVAVPLTTDVPSHTGSGTCLSTGSDSPVSADCCTARSFDTTRRASAGTRSPADSRTTSPGTTARTGTSSHEPSRSTVAVGMTDAFSRSAARCDRNVCQKLRTTPSRTIVTMMPASVCWPSAADTIAAARRMATSGVANRRTSWRSAESRWTRTGSLGPNCASRAAASADVSPVSATRQRYSMSMTLPVDARTESAAIDAIAKCRSLDLQQSRRLRLVAFRHLERPADQTCLDAAQAIVE